VGGWIENSFGVEQNMPNPSSGHTYINYSLPPDVTIAEFIVTNSVGQVIEKTSIDPRSRSIEVNTQTYGGGTYLYYVRSGDLRSAPKRMIVVK
jgi:hypothetical protein